MMVMVIEGGLDGINSECLLFSLRLPPKNTPLVGFYFRYSYQKIRCGNYFQNLTLKQRNNKKKKIQNTKFLFVWKYSFSFFDINVFVCLFVCSVNTTVDDWEDLEKLRMNKKKSNHQKKFESEKKEQDSLIVSLVIIFDDVWLFNQTIWHLTIRFWIDSSLIKYPLWCQVCSGFGSPRNKKFVFYLRMKKKKIFVSDKFSSNIVLILLTRKF